MSTFRRKFDAPLFTLPLLVLLQLFVRWNTVIVVDAFASQQLLFEARATSTQQQGQFHFFAYKVNIHIVGRRPQRGVGEAWLDDAYSIYETRLRGGSANMELITTWHKNDEDLCRHGVDAEIAKSHAVVLLDPKGNMYTSEEFATAMYQWLNRGGSRLSFIIGGADGLPLRLKQQPFETVSLSALTFTHQFARIVLAEQIYRASEIRKGSAYHK